MSARIAFLACIALACFGLSGDALAQGSANVATQSQWCYQLAMGGQANAAISPLVECLTDTQQGFFPAVTSGFFNQIPADYTNMVNAMLLLAIMYFGIKLMFGGVRQLKSETLVLGLKMGGILYFTNHAYSLYIDMLNIMQTLSSSVAISATSAHTAGFCINSLVGSGAASGSTSAWQDGLWGRWDCILGFLLGWGGAGFAVSSIASFLFLIMGSMGLGVLVFFVAIYLIFSIIFAALRFVHIYLMSVLALSFLFCLGFIFVPLLIFNNTYAYFQKWLTLVFSFVLTPVIMFGFMGMMLVMLDITIFSGPYSIYCTIGGSAACANGTAGSTLFSNMTSNVNYKNSITSLNGNANLQDAFKEMFLMGLNGPNSMMNVGDVFSNAPTLKNLGLLGFPGQLATSGSSYDQGNHPEMARTGFDMPMLNLSNLATNAGYTCTSSSVGSEDTTSEATEAGSGVQDNTYVKCPWLEAVLISFCIAALMCYIMYSLLDYIPTLASDLAGQGTMSANTLFANKDDVFGQGMFNKGLDASKKGASNILSKFKSGGANAALSGRGAAANQAMLNQMSDLVSDRD